MLKVVGASLFQTKVSSMILATVAVVGIIIVIMGEMGRVEEDGNYAATLYWVEGSGFRIEYWGQGNILENIPEGAARAYYNPRTESTGWAILEVQTHANYPDWVQAYSAGFLEGSLTWQLIHWHWVNTMKNTCAHREQFCEKSRHFIQHNWKWVRAYSKKHEDKDPFWHQVELYFVQLEGLEFGWRYGVERSRQTVEDISKEDFLWMNAINDLADLEFKFNSTHKNPNPHMSDVSMFSSAFIKLLPDSKHLFVAHNTGNMYQTMLRMLKRYQFNYHQMSTSASSSVRGNDITFSGYPGVLSSLDDFYVVSGEKNRQGEIHKMIVMGTKLDNYNRALWSKVSYENVLIGPRVMAANRLAYDGKSWSQMLSKFHSGTGNKQWMLASYGRIVTIQTEQDDFENLSPLVLKTSTEGSENTHQERSSPSNPVPTSDDIDVLDDSKSLDSGILLKILGVTSKNSINDLKSKDASKNFQENNIILEKLHSDFNSEESMESETNEDDSDNNQLLNSDWLNSGLVFHKRRFTSYKGLLWIVEQMPGLTHASDESNVLHSYGYWASYGVPFFKNILTASGTTKMELHYGDLYSRYYNPKSLIFEKYQDNVTDLLSLVNLMRSKGNTVDSLSMSNPINVISGRGDIYGKAVGTTDCKIFSGVPGSPTEFHAISGPSFNLASSNKNNVHLPVEPFQWSKSNVSKHHRGQPDTWQFDLLSIRWIWNNGNYYDH